MSQFFFKQFLFITLCLIICTRAAAQENVLTFGVQYKPIFPVQVFNNVEVVIEEENFTNTITPAFGNSFGMVVRKGLTNLISFETGINFIQRNYKLDYAVADSNDYANNTLRIISYEIPVSMLVYIRLGDKLFMNASMGVSGVLFPSNVKTDIVTAERTARFFTEGKRRSWFQGALVSNLGFEYRTEKKGYYYIGASLHLPFENIYYVSGTYVRNQIETTGFEQIRGSFITLDLRYFFNEKAQTTNQRKQSVKN